MGAARRPTNGTRRPPRRLSIALLVVPLLVTLVLMFTLGSWWPVDHQRLIARRSAVMHRAKGRLLQQAHRPAEYMQLFAAHEASNYSQQCRERYHGVPFLENMQQAWRQPVCSPQPGGPLNSSISCWFQFEKYAEAYCSGANLALDLAKFEEEEAALPKAASNLGADGGWSSVKRVGVAGELRGDCQLHGRVGGAEKWKEESFGNGAQKWLYNTFRSSAGDAQQPVCVDWVPHPAYFLNDKYDSTNLWHALEDVTHAFEAWVLKGWGSEAQVVVLDKVTPEGVLGPTYWPVWQKAFGAGRAPTLLASLARDAAAAARRQNGGDLPPGAALCFKDVFFNVHGGISLLSRSIESWTECESSTTVNALVHFLLDSLQLTDVVPASHAGLPARRQAAATGGALWHPGQERQEQQRGDGGGSAAGMRVVWALRSTRAGYQSQVLELLQQRIPQETGAEVVAIEFGKLGIEEQIRRVRQADVLVGYHGAALTLALYMAKQSALVEIEEMFRCTCYTNCARWRGHPYSLIRTSDIGEDPVRIAEAAVTEVKSMLERVGRSIRSGGADEDDLMSAAADKHFRWGATAA